MPCDPKRIRKTLLGHGTRDRQKSSDWSCSMSMSRSDVMRCFAVGVPGRSNLNSSSQRCRLGCNVRAMPSLLPCGTQTAVKFLSCRVRLGREVQTKPGTELPGHLRILHACRMHQVCGEEAVYPTNLKAVAHDKCRPSCALKRTCFERL